MTAITRSTTPLPRKQAGVAIVLVTVGMLALIAVTGLALDMGHVFVNKTRLQNGLDAAALSAAKELVLSGGDMDAATVAARNTFALNQDEGNEELAGIAPADVDVEFSASLVPWIPNSGAQFVRVSVATFSLDAFLISVLGIDDKPVVASATAGPDQANCAEPFPILVCGDKDNHNPDDPVDPMFYGYRPGQQLQLKFGGGGCPNNPGPDDPQCDPNGPGNFKLLDVGSGKKAIRLAMCGAYDGACILEGDELDVTEPGNAAGPVAQGLNWRFGDPHGSLNSAECGAPDTNTQDYGPAGGPFYTDYYLKGIPGGSVGNHRRVVPLPVGQCTEQGGKKKVEIFEDSPMCFLLTRRATQGAGGNPGTGGTVYGEFLGKASDLEDAAAKQCLSSGYSSPDPDAVGGPVIIILYKDQVMGDS